MALDLTGNARHNPDVHYRRYLSPHGDKLVVICVQDFDYNDYDAARFLDTLSFDTEEEARLAPIDLSEAIIAASDPESAEEALRIIRVVQAQAVEAKAVPWRWKL